jgi:uncharacterized protein YhhL (DUF1145 family)
MCMNVNTEPACCTTTTITFALYSLRYWCAILQVDMCVISVVYRAAFNCHKQSWFDAAAHASITASLLITILMHALSFCMYYCRCNGCAHSMQRDHVLFFGCGKLVSVQSYERCNSCTCFGTACISSNLMVLHYVQSTYRL